jgi:hypothetical protein
MPHYHGEDDTRVPACTIGHSLAWRVPYFRSTQVAFLHAGLIPTLFILPYSFCLIQPGLPCTVVCTPLRTTAYSRISCQGCAYVLCMVAC